MCTCNFKTKKEEKALIAYVNEDNKEEETANTCDDETVNKNDDDFSIHECGDKILQ